MAKFCFVSYEIHPTVKGGCGVFLNNAARLLLSQGNVVVFLLDIPKKDFAKFVDVDRLALPNAQNCHAYRVEELAAGMKIQASDFLSVFEFRAYRFHVAAREIIRLEKPDMIEFVEYCGLGHQALNSKVAGLGYQDTHLAVRLHSSLELIDHQQPGNIHDIDRYMMYGLEHHALRLAETVLYPSKTYLEKAYYPFYEPWFGNTVFSKPPLIDKLAPAISTQNPDIVLFYGRLHGIKGVDLFIDSATLYLNNPDHPRREFYLVGYDSNLPPGPKQSYQAYLRNKIPPQFQEYFHFTGQLSRQEFAALLPKVLFAVIPSYFESFCYSAHELYEARIPIVVSNIPAFQDYFQNEVNALVFDGTVSQLAQQMTRLSIDDELRQKITYPYSVSENPLGDFYTSTKHSSWICHQDRPGLPSLLICILCDQPEKLSLTLQSLKVILTDHMKTVILRPVQEDDPDHVGAWFLGKLYSFEDEQGQPYHPTQVFTAEALLVLKAGDLIEPSYIKIGLSTLQRQSEISFVGCWKKIKRGRRTTLETLSLDASLELMPFLSSSPFSRFITRTVSGKLLLDLFDPRAGRLGEIAYLWRMDTESSCGIIIPEPLLTRLEEDEQVLDNNALDYLIIQDNNSQRQKRLARFLLSLPNRSKSLRKKTFSREPRLDRVLMQKGTQAMYWLGSTRISQWLDKIPWLKKGFRKVAETLKLLEPKDI